MSFTNRSVHRALGGSGRIQPRVASSMVSMSPEPAALASELEVMDVDVDATAFERHVEIGEREAVADDRVDVPAHAGRESTRTTRLGRERTEAERTEAGRERTEAGRTEAGRTEAGRERTEAGREPGLEVAITEPASPRRQPEVRSFRARALAQGAPARSSFAGIEAELALVAAAAASRGSEAREGHGLAGEASPRAALEDVLEPRTLGSRASESLAPKSPAIGHAADPSTRSPASEPDERWSSSSPAGAARRPGRRGASESVVRVEIGKVEFRAARPPAEPARPVTRIPKPGAFVSLQQYMQKRGRS